MKRMVSALIVCSLLSLSLLAPLAFADCPVPVWVLWYVDAHGQHAIVSGSFGTRVLCERDAATRERDYAAFMHAVYGKDGPPADEYQYQGTQVCLPAPMVPLVARGAQP